MASKRKGVIGGTVGFAAAVTTAGVAYAFDRNVAHRRQQIVRTNFNELGHLPFDRAGVLATSDGTGLYYEEVGPRDAQLTAIFVHGYTLNLGSYHFQRKALVEEFGDQIRFVFYDQRSHGRSDRSQPDHCEIDQLGDDLGEVIDALAPTGRIILVGHSMGGMTVMALADRHPHYFVGSERRVSAVALISTSTGKLASVTLGLPAMLARMKGPLLPLLLNGARSRAKLVERGRGMGTDLAWVLIRRFAFADKAVDPAVVEYLTQMIAGTRIEVIAEFYGPLMNHEKLDALAVLADVPTVIICGDSDTLTPPEHSQEMAEALPKASLVVIENAGHLATMERPEEVNDALIQLFTPALADATPRRRWLRVRR
ncbi:pimeloyl-ACP methyl ester carboxylesterase [Jatrophihabitans sp. GAS493]|uniref:alpha/beta fold hydrolase n=1 Tax=Jatrophihabitans sp. GAS493 TaxID=1907575 RepID=UPI000BB89582|nr:alpha/beta hydrolase [Jatrophihabitans sp. GAS493]SOD70394.1 pimeloyl-ACP methyl ester carboxylesterase [Jatrophihabitans sp. GAS493]